MKQIKVFRSSRTESSDEFSAMVNSFCKQRNVLDITFRTEVVKDVVIFICCVIYEG